MLVTSHVSTENLHPKPFNLAITHCSKSVWVWFFSFLFLLSLSLFFLFCCSAICHTPEARKGHQPPHFVLTCRPPTPGSNGRSLPKGLEDKTEPLLGHFYLGCRELKLPSPTAISVADLRNCNCPLTTILVTASERAPRMLSVTWPPSACFFWAFETIFI